jgi:hypothetical protein
MRHQCPGLDDCRICQAAIEAAEDGDYFTEAELDARADGAGADMVFGR